MNFSLQEYLESKKGNGIKNLDRHEFLDESSITTKALKFALKAHENQLRKDGQPYVNHLIAVANMVRKSGYDENYIAAAYLHDIVEDTKYTFLDVENNFGQFIMRLVKHATESDKKLPWKVRKQETIKKIETLSKKENIILLCDKIHNIEDMIEGFTNLGESFFDQFHAKKEEQKWYYENLIAAFKKVYAKNDPLLLRLEEDFNKLFLCK